MTKEIELTIKPQFVQNYIKGYPLISKEYIDINNKTLLEGTIVNLVDNQNRFIAKGYYGLQNKGCGWILTQQKDETIDERYFTQKIKTAIDYRKSFFEDKNTTAFRDRKSVV